MMPQPHGNRMLKFFSPLLALTLALLPALALAEFTVELYPENEVRIVNQGTALGSERASEVDYDGYAEAEVAAVTVNFPTFSPAIYVEGSGKSIDFIVDGALPAGADLDVKAWHVADREYVESFDVSLGDGNWSVSAADMELLSIGQYELQATLNVPGRKPVQIAQRYLVVPEGLEDEPTETWYDLPTPEEIAAIPEPIIPIIPGGGLIDFAPTPGAQVYHVSESGSDSNDGLTESTPLRTLNAAYQKIGDKDGDWILLKAGDKFNGGFGSFAKSGRSPEQPLLIGVYGSGPRPVVHTDGEGFINAFGQISHVVIEGIHLYANKRMVTGAYPSGVAGKEYGIRWMASGKNITLQDMKIEGYIFNVVFQGLGKGQIQNVTLRRCIIIDAYGHYLGSKGGHSSGLYLENTINTLIDECFFDHNGWRPGVEGASRTKFNHNVYSQKNCEKTNAFRTVFSQGSHHGIQVRGGGQLVDNLFVRNALQAFVAQAPSLMENNVCLEGDDMNSSNPQYHRGSGLEVLPCEQAIVRGNLMVDKIGSAAWSGGIEVKWREDVVIPPPVFNVLIENNTVARWTREYNRESITAFTDRANITKRNNVMDASSGGTNVTFVDPTRTLHTYLPGGYQAFLEGGRNRERGSWDPVYGAATFNNWMREGYKTR